MRKRATSSQPTLTLLRKAEEAIETRCGSRLKVLRSMMTLTYLSRITLLQDNKISSYLRREEQTQPIIRKVATKCLKLISARNRSKRKVIITKGADTMTTQKKRTRTTMMNLIIENTQRVQCLIFTFASLSLFQSIHSDRIINTLKSN